MFVGYALFAAFVLEHIAAYGRRPDRQSVRLERLRKIDEWITFAWWRDWIKQYHTMCGKGTAPN